METSLWFALLAAVSWGVAPLFEKWGVIHTSPFYTLLVQSIVVTSTLVVVGISSGQLQGLSRLTSFSWMILIIAGLLSGLLAQIFYYKALQFGNISRIIPLISSLQIVIASFLAAYVWNEPMNFTKVMGTLFVVLGIFLLR